MALSTEVAGPPPVPSTAFTSTMSETRPPQQPPPPSLLYKQKSWSPDAFREEAWLRRKGNNNSGNGKHRRSKSLKDEDLEELKACIELGFGFDFPEATDHDQRLSETLPALGLYYAVKKEYNESLSKSTASFRSSSSSSSSYSASDCDALSPQGSPLGIFEPGDNPQMVKTRLRQWAQVVAFSVRQC